jgi:hypothetical protein
VAHHIEARRHTLVRVADHAIHIGRSAQVVTRAVFKPYIDAGIARAAAAIVPVEFSLRASS